jgi:hypothetical protein
MKKILMLLALVSSFAFANSAIPANARHTAELKNREYYLLDKLENMDKKLLENANRYRTVTELNEPAANVAPVCKVYASALNKYPLVDNFVNAPMQPDIAEFSYPNWQELDSYEYKDLLYKFMKTEPDELFEMYYARADISNSGKKRDLVRFDANKIGSKANFYMTHLVVFNDEIAKKFVNVDKDLSGAINSFFDFHIYDIFFYRDTVYIKKIAYDYNDRNEFYYMFIKKFNNKNELETLCLISMRNIDKESKNVVEYAPVGR